MKRLATATDDEFYATVRQTPMTTQDHLATAENLVVAIGWTEQQLDATFAPYVVDAVRAAGLLR